MGKARRDRTKGRKNGAPDRFRKRRFRPFFFCFRQPAERALPQPSDPDFSPPPEIPEFPEFSGLPGVTESSEESPGSQPGHFPGAWCGRWGWGRGILSLFFCPSESGEGSLSRLSLLPRACSLPGILGSGRRPGRGCGGRGGSSSLCEVCSRVCGNSGEEAAVLPQAVAGRMRSSAAAQRAGKMR